MNSFLRQPHIRRAADSTPASRAQIRPVDLYARAKPESATCAHERGDTCRDHDEEHHSHPWRDVAEHFARGVIHIGHRILA